MQAVLSKQVNASCVIELLRLMEFFIHLSKFSFIHLYCVEGLKSRFVSDLVSGRADFAFESEATDKDVI